ncbi:MAG: hypothetical protein ACFFE2_16610 [Candidatus Thorarchaeota archaeon]
MAFPEDPPKQYSRTSDSPLMQYDNNALFGMMLQFGGGIITMTTYGLALAFIGVLLITLPPGWPINHVGIIGEILLLPVGFLQVLSGWRLYKKQQGAINFAIQLDICSIIIQLIVDITAIMVFGYLESPEFSIVFVGINVVAVFLLTRPGVKEQFGEYSDFHYNDEIRY